MRVIAQATFTDQHTMENRDLYFWTLIGRVFLIIFLSLLHAILAQIWIKLDHFSLFSNWMERSTKLFRKSVKRCYKLIESLWFAIIPMLAEKNAFKQKYFHKLFDLLNVGTLKLPSICPPISGSVWRHMKPTHTWKLDSSFFLFKDNWK